MIKSIKYNIDEKVNITELERKGRILSIWITPKGVKYEVRYFDDAQPKETYFFEDEISHIDK